MSVRQAKRECIKNPYPLLVINLFYNLKYLLFSNIKELQRFRDFLFISGRQNILLIKLNQFERTKVLSRQL